MLIFAKFFTLLMDRVDSVIPDVYKPTALVLISYNLSSSLSEVSFLTHASVIDVPLYAFEEPLA